MNSTVDALSEAASHYRTGNLSAARGVLEKAVSLTQSDARLSGFLGLVACQMCDPLEAIPHLQNALRLMPDDLSARVNLATALLEVGDFSAARAICLAGNGDLKLRRLSAYAHQQLGEDDAAISDYRAVLAIVDSDFESWNNLANLLTKAGHEEEAVEAFEQAIRLRRDIPELYINYSKALNRWERHEDRQVVMRAAAAAAPDSADVYVELGLAESSARNFSAAEDAFRRAIVLSRGFTPAFIELATLLENLNKLDDLAALVAETKRRSLPLEQTAFIEAWALKRQGRDEEALPLAQAVGETVDAMRRYQLIGQIQDRLGNVDEAFSAFSVMNRASTVSSGGIKMQGGSYLEEVRAAAARLTPERVAAWTKATVENTAIAPTFIVGFPRSGTTLTDTLLMNIPNLHVMEEMPILRQVEIALGDPDRIASLEAAEIKALRARYFEVLNSVSPPKEGQLVVDKFPLHMARAPLIHRIFPEAKIIFVERHPCDVVLSCFMANFQLNRAVVHFLDLEHTARLYESVLEAWTRAEALLPLNVHRIRYERMVDDLETEMRNLLSFLNLEWDPQVLDNRAAAAKRDHIRTASYSQVTEPIYRRASGRWSRYRRQLEPVLPILEPWVQRLGYSM